MDRPQRCGGGSGERIGAISENLYSGGGRNGGNRDKFSIHTDRRQYGCQLAFPARQLFGGGGIVHREKRYFGVGTRCTVEVV